MTELFLSPLQMGKIFTVRQVLLMSFLWEIKSNTDKRVVYTWHWPHVHDRVLLFLTKSSFFSLFFNILLWIIPLEPSWAQSGLQGWMCLPGRLQYFLYILVDTEKVTGLKLLVYMNENPSFSGVNQHVAFLKTRWSGNNDKYWSWRSSKLSVKYTARVNSLISFTEEYLK